MLKFSIFSKRCYNFISIYLQTGMFQLLNAHCIAVMLTWFIDNDVARNGLYHKQPIEEHQPACIPDNVLATCRDKDSDSTLLHHSASNFVEDVVRTKLENEDIL